MQDVTVYYIDGKRQEFKDMDFHFHVPVQGHFMFLSKDEDRVVIPLDNVRFVEVRNRGEPRKMSEY